MAQVQSIDILDIQALRGMVIESENARLRRANAEMAKLIAESQKLLAQCKFPI